jgi:TonB family protein
VQISGSGVLGTLDEDQAQAALGLHAAEMKRCKDAARPPSYVGGTVELRFRVARSGEVARVFIERSSLGSREIERCLLGIARGVKFSPPRGGEAELGYPIEFAARVAAHQWTSAQIQPDLTKHARALGACGGGAPIMLTVYIGPGGRVTSAGAASSEPVDDGYVDCMVRTARSIRFTDPLGVPVRAQAEVPAP